MKASICIRLVPFVAAACSADVTELTFEADPSTEGGSVLEASTLRRGDTGPEVAAAHSYLTQFGYFENTELRAKYPRWRAIAGQPPLDPTVFGAELEHAVRELQARSGLAVTGELDPPTLELMDQPRCGVPDSLPHVATDVEDKWAAYASPRWRSNHNVKYSVAPVPASFQGPKGEDWPDLMANELAGAFKRWGRTFGEGIIASTNTDLTFEEVAVGAGGAGEIKVIFCETNASAGCSDFFVGTPPPLADANSTTIRFNANILWDSLNTTGGTDFSPVAMHEMGHSIGLAHSSVTSGALKPVMFATVDTTNLTLRIDDLQALAVSPYTHWRSIAGANQVTDMGASAVDNAEHVWMVGTAAHADGFKVYKWNENASPPAFSAFVPSAGGVRIDVKGSEPWVVTSSGMARSFTAGAWQNRGDCNFVDIGANASSVWALGTPSLGSDYSIYRFVGNAASTATNCPSFWRLVEGFARYIDLEPSGSPWVVQSGGSIIHRNGVTASSDGVSWSHFGGLAKDISIGPERWGAFSAMWITGYPTQTQDIFAFNLQSAAGGGTENRGDTPARNQWYRAPDGHATFITVGAGAMPWVVAPDKSAWRRRP